MTQAALRTSTPAATRSPAGYALAALAALLACLALALVGAPAALADAGDFEQPPTSPEDTGALRGPNNVAVADFDNDGHLDQVVTDFTTANRGNVRVLEGSGSGNFSRQPIVEVGEDPRDVAVADFNGDGDADLAVVNRGDDDVTILFGTGTGDFTEAPTSTENVRNRPTAIAAGDFNGDTNPDLAVTNSGPDDVTILLGFANGDFVEAPGSPYDVGDGPTDIVAADFNGDGDQDLATANFDASTVTILAGQGTGTFAFDNTVNPGPQPSDIEVGEFNGDGDPDLAVAVSGVAILLGSSGRTFTAAATSPESVGDPFAQRVAIGDFDRDGNADLAATTSGSSSAVIAILLGDGTGDFVEAPTSPESAGGGFLRSLAAGDFDEDGYPDLTVPSPGPCDFGSNGDGCFGTDIYILLNQPEANLIVGQADSPDPVGAGQTLTYDVGVRNFGPQPAADVVFTYDRPANVTNVSVTSSKGSCAPVDVDTIECDLGTLADGELVDITIEVTPTQAGQIDNVVSVSSATPDPTPSDQSSSEQTTVEARADLALDKSDDPDPVGVGDPLTYTLETTNNGPSDASNVEVEDDLPASVTYDASASDSRCTESSGTVTCDLGALAASASDAAEIVVTPQSAGTITNNATVAADETDPDPSDNSDGAKTTVGPAPPGAELSLRMADSPDPVTVGKALTYVIGITNFGPEDATNVVVTDTLPASVDYDGGTSDSRCTEASGTVTCDLGTIASGNRATVEIVVKPNEAGQITNTASVAADEADSDSANNEEEEKTTVEDPSADLTLTKSDSPDPVSVGDPITYTIAVSNNGPDAASNVTVTDDLPGGVSYDDAASDPRCDAVNVGTVSCDLGTLANSGSDSVEIVVTPNQAGSISNDASVAADEFDPTPGNNEDTEATTVDPPPPAATCRGEAATIVAAGPGLTTTGTSGRDVIVGTSGPDTIRSRGGDDLICSLGGADSVRSGGGSDNVLSGGGADTVRSGGGADVTSAGSGADTLVGGGAKDKLRGSAGRDDIRGGPGNDNLNGGSGNDRLFGQNGRSDTLRGGSGRDLTHGGPGPRDRCLSGETKVACER